jgi:cold shock CspA family protein
MCLSTERLGRDPARRTDRRPLVSEIGGQTPLPSARIAGPPGDQAQPQGRIAALHPDRDYGLIAAADGRELYFHRNGVAADAFDRLEVGQEVRFSEAVDLRGPRATLVRPLDRHHAG